MELASERGAMDPTYKRIRGALLISVLLVVHAILNLFVSPVNIKDLSATATDGVIERVSVHRDDRRESYTPFVTFTDSDHLSHTAHSLVEYGKRPRVGMKVSVHYNPFQPEKGCLIVGDEKKLESMNQTYRLELLGGVGAAGYALVMFIKSKPNVS